MRFLTQMAKAKVISVYDGILQAQYNGVVYEEYSGRFTENFFATDAKQFFQALITLDENYKVFDDENFIYLVDDRQEFRLAKCALNELLEIEPTLVYVNEHTQAFVDLRPFVTQDFPGYFLSEDWIEVLHPSMIVRTANYLPFQGCFSVGEIPADHATFRLNEKGLWISFNTHEQVCFGKLEIEKPETSQFFKDWPELTPIPKILNRRWVRCKKAEFICGSLNLDDTCIIEGVHGKGTYDGVLFSKVIRNATHWQMDDNLLYFASEDFAGVLENVDA